jgi:hypothetical protein
VIASSSRFSCQLFLQLYRTPCILDMPGQLVNFDASTEENKTDSELDSSRVPENKRVEGSHIRLWRVVSGGLPMHTLAIASFPPRHCLPDIIR